ncbi:MAG: hypothetical protein QOJ23_906, partial [Actinomycetota bacterium]|nr:hypothetical protein [Actinomycetota bacterium]
LPDALPILSPSAPGPGEVAGGEGPCPSVATAHPGFSWHGPAWRVS